MELLGMLVIHISFLLNLDLVKALLDMTLVNSNPLISTSETSLMCVLHGSPMPDQVSIARDISAYSDQPKSPLEQSKTEKYSSSVLWSTEKKDEGIGVFFCEGRVKDDIAKITTIKMSQRAHFLPEVFTITVNNGESTTIRFQRHQQTEADLMIYKKDIFISSVPQNDVSNICEHHIQSVNLDNAGVYTAFLIGQNISTKAFTRLIVRKCQSGKWGADCMKNCPVCLNGGVCHDEMGHCICPPGFMGKQCETACAENTYGQNCLGTCKGGSCRSSIFCLPDPYGCSCATGWKGLQCDKACDSGYYGANCQLKCECVNGQVCNRFRGCLCLHCDNRGFGVVPPQLVNSSANIEVNTGVTLHINCTATGHPLPVHGNIRLITPHGKEVNLTSTRTITHPVNYTISTFRVAKITPSDSGEWICRVKTSAGIAKRPFNVSVKVPPRPQTPPTKAKSGIQYIIVNANVEPHIGDGPIIQTKLLYKPTGALQSWTTVEVTGASDVVKLDNLQPMCQYNVCVQLSRPGDRGEGHPGPVASFWTECSNHPAPMDFKILPKSQTSLRLTWQQIPAILEESIYHIECHSTNDSMGQPTILEVPGNLSSLDIEGLQPKQQYQCRVWAQSKIFGEWCDMMTTWTYSNKRPPAPTNIKIFNISDSSAFISWAIEDGNSISSVIIRYKIYGADDYTQETEIKIKENISQFQLRGLEPNSPYLVELCAKNNIGESEPNLTMELHTLQKSTAYTEQKTGHLLLYAILGSAGMTCLTILLAFCIVIHFKQNNFQRRIVQAFQNSTREEPIIQFNSGTLTLSRKTKPQMRMPVVYPVLQWDDIKFEDIIGEGNFGQVLKARIKKNGHKMNAAIKRMKEYASKDDHRDFAGELEVLCRLGHHPNIINLLGACEHRGYLYVAIEFAPHGNLLDFLRNSRVLETDPAYAIAHSTASTLSSQQLLQFAADVSKGMDYLSQKQFIHRDLAARNVLVGEGYVAKIADFGLSRGKEVYVKKTMGRLPVRWMAIESLNYSVYTTNSDVWSYGILLWEIVNLGGTPYCGMTCAELYEKLPLGYRMEKPPNCVDEVYELMRQCWREKPYERPTFAQILVSLNRMLEERKTYVNTTLFEKFTYAGIDCSAEEAG
ncbi:angiopoietin-1 receptor [Mobula hypostoma]|uniref:angiopoietin-1 receptor n=1 Tax=Mobula hypostoma TaxID=723540 RepID=UPI002FC3D421